MNPTRTILIALLLAASSAALSLAQSVEQLERQLRDDPTSVKIKAALAEAYLRDCQLEKSLALWRQVLAADPANARARTVVDRLTTQALDLDSHLAVLEKLIERGIVAEVGPLLNAAGQRAATDAQKAQVLLLRGRLASARGDEAAASAAFQSAARLHPAASAGGRAAIAMAWLESANGRPDEARRLLAEVRANAKLPDEVRQAAELEIVRLDSAGLSPADRLAARRDAVGRLTADSVRRDALREMIDLQVHARGRWTPQAVELAEQFLRTNPDEPATLGLLADLRSAAAASQDPATLDAIFGLLEGEPREWSDPAGQRAWSFAAVETLLARAVLEEDAAAMAKRLARAGTILDALAKGGEVNGDRRRVRMLRGRSLLIAAQKLAVLKDATAALPALNRAREHFMAVAALPGEPAAAFERLDNIAALLEHLGEYESAAALYRELAARFPQRPQGRDALLRSAQLLAGPLDDPTAALEVYAEYAARYPADLSYRQLAVGDRLRRLGYANVLDFQKRNDLKPDGVFGPASRSKLEELEAAFDQVRSPSGQAEPILRGRFVHPAMFRIASQLAAAGRTREAVAAYRLVINLFPTKKEADDAALAVARLFRDNLLFAEALGAYRATMQDFPKGDKTSEAYVEAAGCLETLGRWAEARELYELYAKKFPKYPHVALCRERIATLGEIEQYADFLATNPASPKLAEARYQIAATLYKRMGNLPKAAAEFAEVARLHPAHVRAPDALFTAGAAQLKAENFPAARELFAAVVQRYPDSRLADDAQYWIGHTYEYAARALGRLDRRKIVLKRRGLRGRGELAGDLALRRFYNRQAAAGPQVAEQTWGGDTLGVLASGSKRDRVNADLGQAIREYRKVVDNFKMGDMAGNALLRIGAVYTDYLHDPEAGIAAYRELLAHYPASKEAVDALFQVGAYAEGKGQFEQAVKSYQQFIYNYPNEPKVEDAMMAIARCHAQAKAWDKALDAYQSYLTKFPHGRHARAARAQVEWIRMYHF